MGDYFYSRLSYGLIVIIAMAVIPLGSNRPFFWAVNGTLLAIAALVYVRAATWRADLPRVPLHAFKVLALLVALPLAWMIVQIVPLPTALLPADTIASGPGLEDRAIAPISVDPAATIGMIIRYMSYAVIFTLVAQVASSSRRAQRLLKFIFWLCVAESSYAIVALLALGDTILFVPKWAYLGYATGTFVNRNHLATFLGFGVVAGMALLLEELRSHAAQQGSSTSHLRWETARTLATLGTGLAILASGIALAGSRMGATATLCGVAAVFAVYLIHTPSNRRRLLPLVLVAVVAAAGLAALSGGRLLERLGSLETSADDRVLLYRQVVDLIAARPLLGYGAGTFADAFQAFHKLPLSADAVWDNAHSLYLELLADLGVLGLLPPLAIAWLLAFLLTSLKSVSRPPVISASVGVIVLAAVHSTVDFSMQIEANVFAFLAIVSCGFAQAFAARQHGNGAHHREVTGHRDLVVERK